MVKDVGRWRSRPPIGSAPQSRRTSDYRDCWMVECGGGGPPHQLGLLPEGECFLGGEPRVDVDRVVMESSLSEFGIARSNRPSFVREDSMYSSLLLFLSLAVSPCPVLTRAVVYQEPVAAAAQDPIREDLDAAIKGMREAKTRAHEKLLSALKAKEMQLLKSDKEADRSPRERVTAAIKAFSDEQAIPDAPEVEKEVKVYLAALVEAEEACRRAFDKARVAYARNNESDLARAIDHEMRQVVPLKNAWLEVWKPGMKVEGKRSGKVDNAISGQVLESSESYLVLDVQEKNEAGVFHVVYKLKVKHIVGGTVYMAIIEQRPGKGGIKKREGAGSVRLRGGEMKGWCEGRATTSGGDVLLYEGDISISVKPN